MTSRLPHRVVFAKKNEKQKKTKTYSKTDLLKQSTEKKRFKKKQKHTQKPNRSGGARNRTIQKKQKPTQKKIKKESKKKQKRITKESKLQQNATNLEQKRGTPEKIRGKSTILLHSAYFAAFCCFFLHFAAVLILF